jgi:hypothetical protein
MFVLKSPYNITLSINVSSLACENIAQHLLPTSVLHLGVLSVNFSRYFFYHVHVLCAKRCDYVVSRYGPLAARERTKTVQDDCHVLIT